jgi:5-methylcytosine-specific restriction endonuclease McrA
MRQPNTTRSGTAFDHAQILAVWRKGQIIPDQDPDVLRKDVCGAWISWAAYGSITDLGWEIDHIFPAAKGGTDDLENLQPLQWENNRQKSDRWPWTPIEAAA